MVTKKDDQQTLFEVKKTYGLDQIVKEPGNRVLYYLQDGPDSSFVREELCMFLMILKYLLIG